MTTLPADRIALAANTATTDTTAATEVLATIAGPLPDETPHAAWVRDHVAIPLVRFPRAWR